MTYSEMTELDNDYPCDFTQRIGAAHFDPADCIHTPDCALPALRDVLITAAGLALCAGLIAVGIVRSLSRRHTVEQDFAHYLSYSGLWRESADVRAKLFEAFKAGRSQ